MRTSVGLVISAGLTGLAFVVFAARSHPGAFVWAVAAALGVALGAALAFAASRDFVGDLRFMALGVDALTRDDALTAVIPHRALDELGTLVRSFESLRQDFQHALYRERELRRDVERADAAKGAFLQAVSHELRNPLNSILGFADVLLSEIDGPLTAEQREDLRIIHTAGRHLVALFNDVLDLSAAASDLLRLERVDVDVGALLDEVAAELRGQRQGKRVEVKVEIERPLPTIRADPKRLRQIIENLGSNALKFTDEGEVCLGALTDGGRVIIRVRDTGVGISPEDRELIFAEFGQVVERQRSRRGRRGGGAGLGLAIAKTLAELHGGMISVASEPGVGSTFDVSLPIEEVQGRLSRP